MQTHSSTEGSRFTDLVSKQFVIIRPRKYSAKAVFANELELKLGLKFYLLFTIYVIYRRLC